MDAHGTENPQNGGPTQGESYPIELGGTVGQEQQSGHYFTLRYDFLPASVAATEPGLVHASTTTQAVEVYRRHTANSTGIMFKGKLDDAIKDTECLLIYDDETKSFTLEAIAATVSQLRHVRSGSRRL